MQTITLINLTAGKITIGSVTVPPNGSVNVIEVTGDMLVAKQQQLIDVIVEGEEDDDHEHEPIDPDDLDLQVSDVEGAAPLDSPILVGVPEAPTALAGTSTNQLATTEFVQDALAGAIVVLPEPYAKQFEFVTDDLIYKGEAAAGTETSEPLWRISYIQMSEDGSSETWAAGTTAFDKVWDDRETYAYL